MPLSQESISTCRFAQRVAMIKNEAVVNEELDPALVSLNSCPFASLSVYFSPVLFLHHFRYCVHSALMFPSLPNILQKLIINLDLETGKAMGLD